MLIPPARSQSAARAVSRREALKRPRPCRIEGNGVVETLWRGPEWARALAKEGRNQASRFWKRAKEGCYARTAHSGSLQRATFGGGGPGRAAQPDSLPLSAPSQGPDAGAGFDYLNAPAARPAETPCSTTTTLSLSQAAGDRACGLSRTEDIASGYVPRPCRSSSPRSWSGPPRVAQGRARPGPHGLGRADCRRRAPRAERRAGRASGPLPRRWRSPR